MQKVIGVRFKKAGRIHYYNPGQFDIEKGDSVIIETQRGLEYAQVVISPREIADDKLKVEDIYRKADENDLNRIAENHEKEKEAFDICIEKIAAHNLPMNLIGVEYTFDLNKIIFSFTADGRVDFRELVKDLAAVFRTRIELRQVGVRDEAKLLGGIGGCGRPLCCSSFLGDFIPVSIRMAKEQNLSLNPTKISGICGRLMCCLKYENDYYCEQCPHTATAPTKEFKLGARVVIDEGEGKIISLNRQRRTATIILDNSKTAIASWDNIFEAESSDEEVKTIVATVGEEEDQANESDSKTIVIEEEAEKFSNRNRKSSIKIPSSSQFRSDFPASIKSTQPSQDRINLPARENRNFRENKNDRDSRDFRSSRSDFRDNREFKDSRDRSNKKFQKRDRRNDDYQRGKKSRPRRD